MNKIIGKLFLGLNFLVVCASSQSEDEQISKSIRDLLIGWMNVTGVYMYQCAPKFHEFIDDAGIDIEALVAKTYQQRFTLLYRSNPQPASFKEAIRKLSSNEEIDKVTDLSHGVIMYQGIMSRFSNIIDAEESLRITAERMDPFNS